MELDKVYEEINRFEITECSCNKCKNMCKTRPCWGTPKDIKKIIENGHSNKLMLDWWDNDDNTKTYIVAPAIVGYESEFAPDDPTGWCAFFDLKSGKCEIHDIKPIEGKTAIHDPKRSGMHGLVAKTWDSDEGKKLVEDWRKRENV